MTKRGKEAEKPNNDWNESFIFKWWSSGHCHVFLYVQFLGKTLKGKEVLRRGRSLYSSATHARQTRRDVAKLQMWGAHSIPSLSFSLSSLSLMVLKKCGHVHSFAKEANAVGGWRRIRIWFCVFLAQIMILYITVAYVDKNPTLDMINPTSNVGFWWEMKMTKI